MPITIEDFSRVMDESRVLIFFHTDKGMRVDFYAYLDGTYEVTLTNLRNKEATGYMGKDSHEAVSEYNRLIELGLRALPGG